MSEPVGPETGTSIEKLRPGTRAGAVGALAGALSLLPVLACQPRSSEIGELARAGALKGKNLLIITLDTTRQDHVGAYGHADARGTTPSLDRLAADGAIFLNAYSQTNVTNPSHVAIFTGLYALDARVMNNRTTLTTASPGVDTLPAAFQRAGYRTTGFPATLKLTKLI